MNSPIFQILTLKLVVMATSLELSERGGGQIGNLRSNTYHMEFIHIFNLYSGQT